MRDDGVERFAFGHALVRDTLTAGLSATRRARVHARVAEALEGLPERATERARHWLAAGPVVRRPGLARGRRRRPRWPGAATPTSSPPCCSAAPWTRMADDPDAGACASATTC